MWGTFYRILRLVFVLLFTHRTSHPILLFCLYVNWLAFLGSQWNTTADACRNTWGAFRATPKRKGRTSCLQIRAWNCNLGSNTIARGHWRSLQNIVRCSYRMCWHLVLSSRPFNSINPIESFFFLLFFHLQNYDTSESKLRREFEVYGPIKKIVLVHNIDTGKPRGYAFIEYEHERDMHCK